MQRWVWATGAALILHLCFILHHLTNVFPLYSSLFKLQDLSFSALSLQHSSELHSVFSPNTSSSSPSQRLIHYSITPQISAYKTDQWGVMGSEPRDRHKQCSDAAINISNNSNVRRLTEVKVTQKAPEGSTTFVVLFWFCWFAFEVSLRNKV